jgi:3-methyladenine DNA glycosylase AlkC
MQKDNSIKQWFGGNLAKILAGKIKPVYKKFDSEKYIKYISSSCEGLEYTARINLHADALKEFLPKDYKKSVETILKTLGGENLEETGMFKNFYWVMPFAKFVEKYGLDDFDTSILTIEEITKRGTGEYAVRPFIKKYPKKALTVMKKWSKSKNFHLRRLASEGLRPKLPWASKLETFIENPKPVFDILENLMEDEIKFVQKSVANNLADYLKVNKKEGTSFITRYKKSKNKNTQWILKHATRRVKV